MSIDCRGTLALALALGFLAAACGNNGADGGGSPGTGGSGHSGGSTGSGGLTGSGGVTATGGTTGSGGITATGGMLGSGGARAAGGAPATGGASATGGATSAGGEGGKAAGGSMAGGGTGGSGGTAGSGGGGGKAAGGSMAGGGSTGAGGNGAGATGGAASMCVPGTHAGSGTMHCGNSDSGPADGNYTYNIYSSGQGSGCMTVYGVDATFSATWTNVGDWIARAGLSFDHTKTYDKIGTFSSDFSYTVTASTGGFGNIGIYGWSLNPLHEYYIIENWLGNRPNFTKVGTFTIDGEGTYDIQTNMQKDQPNITGQNADFVQFWSVRTTPRLCGHISISKHFDEWASLNLQLGNLEEARILVEAQNNTGKIDFTTATVIVK